MVTPNSNFPRHFPLGVHDDGTVDELELSDEGNLKVSVVEAVASDKVVLSEILAELKAMNQQLAAITELNFDVEL